MSNILYEMMKDRFLKTAAHRVLDKDSRIVIFSDLHMGDGRSHDDFTRNSQLFQRVLKDYYLPKDYTLILNGDVEELQKFLLPKIMKTWAPVYDLFDAFHNDNRFFKITGNHDSKMLAFMEAGKSRYPQFDAVRLDHQGQDILIYHGHQMSIAYERFNELIGFFLRYGANILRIPNRSTAHSSHRRWKIESHTYNFSRQNKLVSIIGHTHRPLFESMAKTDELRFEIEKLCRSYASKDNGVDHDDIERQIYALKEELESILKSKKEEGFVSRLYSSEFLIPCLFNSGCVIGKRGITAIEIVGETIALIHWQPQNLSPRYSQKGEEFQTPLKNWPGIQRRVTKKDDLRYVFSRIQLLG